MGIKNRQDPLVPTGLINTGKLNSRKQIDIQRELITEVFEHPSFRYNDKISFVVRLLRDVTFTLELCHSQDPTPIWGDQKGEPVTYILGRHDSEGDRGAGTSYYMQYAVAVMPGVIGNMIGEINMRDTASLFIKGTKLLLKEIEYQLERKTVTPLSAFNIRRKTVEDVEANITEPAEVSKHLNDFKDIVREALNVASSWDLIA